MKTLSQAGVVECEIRPEFVAGKPFQLFEGPYSSDVYRPGYDVTPDGQRFVIMKVPEGSAPRQINVIVNWFEELRRRVSTDKTK